MLFRPVFLRFKINFDWNMYCLGYRHILILLRYLKSTVNYSFSFKTFLDMLWMFSRQYWFWKPLLK